MVGALLPCRGRQTTTQNNCDSCSATGDEKGGVEWRRTHDAYLCAKCNHERGRGGSRAGRRGGKGTGGAGRF
jgi:hypothetical protein